MTNATAAELFLVVHTHEFGISSHFVRYLPTTELPYPDLDEVIDQLLIDFEPEKGEVIAVENIEREHQSPSLIEKGDSVPVRNESVP